jgi:glycerate 2-kinase
VRELLEAAFNAAVAAADPAKVLAGYLPSDAQLRSYQRIVVVGAGKAGGSMAAALDAAIAPDIALEGLVITRYGHCVPAVHTNSATTNAARIKVVEAAHPVPDAAGLQATRQVLNLVQSLGTNDLLIALISGGGSSLLTLPVDELSLDDLRQLTAQLLASGAPIEEMNIVRKHLSQVQGGRLAQACKAPMLVLVVSDVAGDDLSAIASGPFAPDVSQFADAQAVINRWNVKAPLAVGSYLAKACSGVITDTPKPNDPLFIRVQHQLIATAHQSLEAAAAVFKTAGYQAVILGDTITGEARDVAQVHAGLVREIIKFNQPFKAPVVLLSGGECTVTLRPKAVGDQRKGRGGRCSEFLLALMHALGSEPEMAQRVCALVADTDGIDGSENNAGALFLSDRWQKSTQLKLDPLSFLDRNDGFSFFEAIDGLVHTGPTLTNVNDFRAIVIR